MTENSFHLAVRDFIRRSGLTGKCEKVIAAVSGGVDSMVLLDVLCELRSEFGLELAVAHFNHLLREKESDDDESFVRSSAKERGLECYVERANTFALSEAKKLSVQETARDLRYAFFNKLRGSLGFQKVATAHHADDNAETILFNIFRGAGVHGLSGIPALRKDIAVIRPLLCVTREEIQAYAEKRGITYREDSSNSHNDYTRNYLRNSLVPEIRKNINPNLAVTLRRTAELFDQLEEYLKDEAAKVLIEIIIRRSATEIVFDLNAFDSKPLFLKEHILLHTAREFSNVQIDFGTVKGMLNIVHAETGASCSLSKDSVFYRNRDMLVFKRVPPINSYRYHLDVNKKYNFEYFEISSSLVKDAEYSNDPFVEYIDAGLIDGELIVRPWSDGDWFIPLGMNEKKKLSDFFIDDKIPLFEKRYIPILLANDNIIWICGKRLDDRYKLTPKTKSILKLEFIPHT